MRRTEPAGASPSVSVALASYNGAAFIGEQLASIAAQTRLPDEVVVSDDGSTDGTQALVDAFGCGAPFPMVRLDQNRLGILENFHAAFAACGGDVIVYCDQDDVWHPAKLERQLAALRGDVMLVMHPSEVVDAALHPLGRQMPANFRTGALPPPADSFRIHGFGHQMMFRRAVLDVMRDVRALPRLMVPDGIGDNFDVFIPFCAALLGTIVVLDEPLVRFRRHAGAASPAGTAENPLSLADRAAMALQRDAEEAGQAWTLIDAVHKAKLGDPLIVGVMHAAIKRKRDRARRQARLALRGGLTMRPALLARAVQDVARPLGFSNDRRLHALKLAVAACARVPRAVLSKPH